VNVRLYILQRATALIMAPLVLAHLVIVFYATNRGLSAADILGRTRGSIGWGAFYTLFVLAAATHGAIGVRVIAAEWARLRGRSARHPDVGLRVSARPASACAPVAAVVLS
jgi:fumarate reductase subunit C